MLELHELVGRHWGQRRATSYRLLSAVEAFAECLGDIVLSMVVAVLPGVAGSRLAEVPRSLGCMLGAVVALWQAVQRLRSMGLSAVVRWLQGFRLVVDSATNSTLIQRLEGAGFLALPAVSGRQVVGSLWEAVLHPATLKQDQALVFGRMKLEVHSAGHTELVGQWHRLVVGEPWHRYRLVALASGIRRVRAEVLHPTRRLQMQGRHGGLLSLSALRAVRRLVRLGQQLGGLCDVRVFYDVFAWRLKALGVAKTELARKLTTGNFLCDTAVVGQYCLCCAKL